MDWSKAKTILIAAFIATNLFLLYNVGQAFPEAKTPGPTGQQVEDVAALLADRGVSLRVDVPTGTPDMPSLLVAYQEYDPARTAERFMEDPVLFGNDMYIKGRETLRISGDRLLVYEQDLPAPGGLPGTAEALKLAEDFLSLRGFSLEDAVLVSDESAGDVRRLEFRQKAGAYTLENGVMRLWVASEGVLRFERLWLERLETGEAVRTVIPATKALLLGIEPLTESASPEIVGIELTYLFDTARDSLTKWQDVKSGTALPVWRIALSDDRDPVYIDAYEGIVIED